MDEAIHRTACANCGSQLLLNVVAGDEEDAIAKNAFQSLFVIGLAPYDEDPMYVDLSRRASIVSRERFDGSFSMNFFAATFYDAVMVYAKALRSHADTNGAVLSCMTKDVNPKGYPKGTTLPVGATFCNELVQGITNATLPFRGG